MVDLGDLVPAGEAAVEAQVSRERLIRMVQCGVVAGAKVVGVWMVSLPSLRELIGKQAAGLKAARIVPQSPAAGSDEVA